MDKFNKTPVHPATRPAPSPPLTPSPAATRFWMTESGDVVSPSRVRSIASVDDVLSSAERAAYETLLEQGSEVAGGDRLSELGYDPLRRQTGLSRKTIQRVVDKLIEKDLVAIDRPADIYTRTPTRYRIFHPLTALARMAEKSRHHVAKIGPGLVFVYPASIPRPGEADESHLSTVATLDLTTVVKTSVST